jgi:prepilin-type N-terminal cleavage/methylation domain-containing protein
MNAPLALPQAFPSLPRGAAASACRPLRRGEGRGSSGRSGFTLIELLVVLIIVGMLVGLVTPAVMQALRKSRNAAIKAEIDMLHMAIMNYKNEYGSFPPCYSDGYAPGSAAFKHLARMFPRCPNPVAQFSAWSPLVPANAIRAWLAGFSTDPTLPVTGGARKRLYDFDQTRVAFDLLGQGVVYHPPQLPQSPFIYISADQYGQLWPPVIPPDSYGYVDSINPINAMSFTIPAGYYAAELLVTKSGVVAGQFANPDTFQILCAGRDGKWMTDDDLSNFWPGTRKEYLDSLKR